MSFESNFDFFNSDVDAKYSCDIFVSLIVTHAYISVHYPQNLELLVNSNLIATLQKINSQYAYESVSIGNQSKCFMDVFPLNNK